MRTNGSLFAGIGGLDLGFERAGFKTIWQVECEPFCNAVLETHWPETKRFGDVRDCGAHNLERVDCITAGVPCQDWSVAGKRAGIEGERSGLFFEFARILRELRPSWFVFENVPGLLSSNCGRDFAVVLSTLGEVGYGLAWRVLDSRFFGVAQRRRRVFIVGSLGTMRAAEVLFERQGGGGDSAPCGEAGPDVAYALAASVRGTGDGHGNAWNSNYVAALDGSPYADREAEHTRLVATLNSGGNSGGFRTEPGEHLVAFNIVGGAQQGKNHAYEAERTGALQHKGNSASGNEAGTLIGAPPDAEHLTLQGFVRIITAYANAAEANADQILSFLREIAHSEDGARRGFGELVPLRPKEVLRPDLLGEVGNGQASQGEGSAAPRPLQGESCEEADGLRGLRINGERGSTPWGRESAKQLLGKHSESVSSLSHGEAQEDCALSGLWETAEGSRALQQAFDSIQKIWRPAADEGEPEHSRLSVRRLTPTECERLQSFPLGWTIPASSEGMDDPWPLLPKGLDSARYRALGNAVTVSLAEWLARRMALQFSES